MNKYELAVVVSAKIEDEERTAVIDRCKALVERFGGVITEVDDWGKKRLAYEIQKVSITSSALTLRALLPLRLRAASASWTMSSDT